MHSRIRFFSQQLRGRDASLRGLISIAVVAAASTAGAQVVANEAPNGAGFAAEPHSGPPPGPPTPPPFAYAACNEKQEGAACSVSLPDREVAGSCVPDADDKLFCLPNEPLPPPPRRSGGPVM